MPSPERATVPLIKTKEDTLMTTEKYKEKLAFSKSCKDHGFRKDDYEIVFSIYRGRDNRKTEVKLTGFTKGGRCILTETESGLTIRFLPHDVMVAIRDTHQEEMDRYTEEKEYEKARRMKAVVSDDTRRLRDAGFGLKPYEVFNPYGDMSQGHLALDCLSKQLVRSTWSDFVF